jgi:hypothetical protein
MRNKIQIAIILFLGLFMLSFSTLKSSSTNKFELPFYKGDTLTWKLLGEIKYEKRKHPQYGEVDFPVVNAKVKTKGKKRVLISGFIVPIDSKSFAISKNVFAACFFCGKAGPESIAGIKFRGTTPKLKTDQYVIVEGLFRYNETNADDWVYNLDDVIIVKGN